PGRFAGLPEPLFWADAFVLARTQSWAEANAAEVARLRLSGMTMEGLARHFGKAVPTVRQALRHARAKDPALAGLPGKVARRRWEEGHAAEVARAHGEGKTAKELAALFGERGPTIRKALRHPA